MDISAMKHDLNACLQKLPPGMVNARKVGEWLQANRPMLEKLIPAFIEKLKPHIAAAAMEGAMGVLDTEEINRACIECLVTFGMQDIAEAAG